MRRRVPPSPFAVGAIAWPALARATVVTEFSQNPFDAAGIVRIVVASVGGLVTVLGFVIALRGVRGRASVRVTGGRTPGIAFERVNQGVVVVIVGVLLLIGSIYFLPTKARETTKTETITSDGNGGTIRQTAD